MSEDYALVGMDLEAMIRLLDRLRGLETRMSAVERTLTPQVRQTSGYWQGPDQRQFVTSWEQQTAPRLRRTVQGLTDAITLLQRQLEEQRQTSAAGPGSSAGGHAAGSGNRPAETNISRPSVGQFIDFADYARPDKKLPDSLQGWARINDDPAELAKLGLSQDDLNRLTKADMQMSIFKSAAGHYVISYEGSSSAADWANNAVGIRRMSEQQDRAIDLAVKIGQHLEPGTFEFTGHSAGGGFAALSSIATGAHATTFNSAGASVPAIVHAITAREGQPPWLQPISGVAGEVAAKGLVTSMLADDLGTAFSSVDNYHTSGDFLSTAQWHGTPFNGGLIPSAIGQQHVLPSQSGNPVAEHDMAAVRKAHDAMNR